MMEITDIAHMVFAFLTPSDRAVSRHVCRQWRVYNADFLEISITTVPLARWRRISFNETWNYNTSAELSGNEELKHWIQFRFAKDTFDKHNLSNFFKVSKIIQNDIQNIKDMDMDNIMINYFEYVINSITYQFNKLSYRMSVDMVRLCPDLEQTFLLHKEHIDSSISDIENYMHSYDEKTVENGDAKMEIAINTQINVFIDSIKKEIEYVYDGVTCTIEIIKRARTMGDQRVWEMNDYYDDYHYENENDY